MLSGRDQGDLDSGGPVGEERLVTRPFVIVTLSAFAFFMYIGTLVPLVPLFIEGPLEGGEFALGLNAAVFATAAIFARPVLGRLADRYGRRSIIIAGALFAATGGMLMSQTDSLSVRMFLRVRGRCNADCRSFAA